MNIYGENEVLRFSSGLHCADCDIDYSEPTPAMFSFNSPLGACETCRGFGRVIGVDFGLVVPMNRSPSGGRGAALADGELQGVPGRPGEVREEDGLHSTSRGGICPLMNKTGCWKASPSG